MRAFTSLQRRPAARRWPSEPAGRQLARLLFTLPSLAFVLFVAGRHTQAPGNQVLAEKSALIRWGADRLDWVSGVWPPLPVAVSGLVGGNLLLIAVVAALFSGGLIHSIVERLTLQRFPWWISALAVVAVLGSPMTAYLMSTDLAQYLSLTFLAMALNGFLRFAVDGRTEGGFQAGLLLALATLCDLSSILHALTMACAAPLIAHVRYRGQRGAGRATAVVLAFPSLAVVAGWVFLQWRFTGSALRSFDTLGAFSFEQGVGGSAVAALRSVGRAVLLSPIFLVSAALLARTSILAALGFLLPLPGLAIGLWLGLRPATGLTVVLISCLALYGLPTARSRRISVVIAAALVVQLVLTLWVTLPLLPVVDEWWTAIGLWRL